MKVLRTLESKPSRGEIASLIAPIGVVVLLAALVTACTDSDACAAVTPRPAPAPAPRIPAPVKPKPASPPIAPVTPVAPLLVDTDC